MGPHPPHRFGEIMKRLNIEAVNALLFESTGELTRAKEMLDKVEYAKAIHAAKNSIELRIKAMYPLVGLDPPHTHDAITGERGQKPDAFGEVIKRLDFGNDLWTKNGIMRLPWLGKMWASAHIFSVYGYGGVPASSLFDPEDARIALDYAGKVEDAITALIDSVKQGRIRVLSEGA